MVTKTVCTEQTPQFENCDQPTGTQSVDRALYLLKLIGAAGDSGASLAELSTAIKVPKPTCRRLLLALLRAGVIEQTHHGNRYWLGSGLFDIAKNNESGFIMTADARACLRELADASGECCLLSLRRGNFAVLVERFDAPSGQGHKATPGAEYPLGIGAAPLAMIAGISLDEAEESLVANDNLIARRYRRASLERILAGRKEAMENGFAINRGMVFDGIWGLGVALKGGSGKVIGAISISTRSEMLISTIRQRQLGEMLVNTAIKLSRHIPH
jgi:DNA-binding IclR family transcriptional regulator